MKVCQLPNLDQSYTDRNVGSLKPDSITNRRRSPTKTVEIFCPASLKLLPRRPPRKRKYRRRAALSLPNINRQMSPTQHSIRQSRPAVPAPNSPYSKHTRFPPSLSAEPRPHPSSQPPPSTFLAPEMDEEIIFSEADEFWRYVQNCVVCENTQNTEDVNRRLVTFLTTVASHIQIHVNDDQDLYRCTLYLIHSPLYEENTVFCVAKQLTLLTIGQLPQNVRLVLSYVLLLDCKRDSSVLQVIQDYRGFEVLYGSLYSLFQTFAVINDEDSRGDTGTIGVMKNTCTAQLDTLFQMCKFLSISPEELKIIDTFFINYIFESLIADVDDDLFNAAKFKFILAVNEQFMIASSEDPSLTNKVFSTIQEHTTSRNFSECLLIFFNREEDTCLQIMVSKLLYLILNNPSTSDLFYHNDLNVLVDVLLRELTDLSEEEEATRNTFLRVLYPLLKNEQFQQNPYKKEPLKSLLCYFAGESENKFWNQTDTTKRLALRCLKVSWLQEKPPVEKEEEPQSSPTDSIQSTPRMAHLEIQQHNDSQTSLVSISKKRPPPPLPRKLVRTGSGQQVPPSPIQRFCR